MQLGARTTDPGSATANSGVLSIFGRYKCMYPQTCNPARFTACCFDLALVRSSTVSSEDPLSRADKMVDWVCFVAANRAFQARFDLFVNFSPIRANGHVFDETKLFPDAAEDMLQLKTQFRQHFYNISRIMDCVHCEKCKLWGKIQTQGMGTALKILFSGDIYERSADNVIRRRPDFHLRRSDIVSLFLAFGK
ncbi:unnamed protein product [Dibothriocephalus latus]|uniref:Uncharacterized protein n=1 Tax=Dibothriocephalus latus TaxID=60516 RepID=A0A3P7N1Z9_DIBLA|nr:unnamed protein product [Dibothriocephalus latus]